MEIEEIWEELKKKVKNLINKIKKKIISWKLGKRAGLKEEEKRSNEEIKEDEKKQN